MTKLYLASNSPRRSLLLSRLTDSFEVIEVNINESPFSNELPSDYVARISIEKAMAAKTTISNNLPILSADTEVVFDGRILGKPANIEEAVDMLYGLSGKAHDVYTAVVLLKDHPNSILNRSRVWFKPFTRNDCKEYCNKLLPLDKSGAYGIQDTAAAYIDRFEGSYSGVMGLPLEDSRKLLIQASIL